MRLRMRNRMKRPQIVGGVVLLALLIAGGAVAAGATGLLGTEAEGVREEQLYRASEPKVVGSPEILDRGRTSSGKRYEFTYQESDRGPCVALSLDGGGGPRACGEMIQPGSHDVAMLQYGQPESSDELLFGLTSLAVDNLQVTPQGTKPLIVLARSWRGHDRKYFITSVPPSPDGKARAVHVAARDAGGTVVEQKTVTAGGVPSAGSTPPDFAPGG